MADKKDISVEFNKDEFLKSLGEQIKNVRLKKGYTAAKLGKITLIDRSHIARLEAGGTNPTSTTLKTICKALEIEMEDLFKGFKF